MSIAPGARSTARGETVRTDRRPHPPHRHRALGTTHRATVREVLALAVAHQLPPLSIDDLAVILEESNGSEEEPR
jgi:hypothetical protein